MPTSYSHLAPKLGSKSYATWRPKTGASWQASMKEKDSSHVISLAEAIYIETGRLPKLSRTSSLSQASPVGSLQTRQPRNRCRTAYQLVVREPPSCSKKYRDRKSGHRNVRKCDVCCPSNRVGSGHMLPAIRISRPRCGWCVQYPGGVACAQTSVRLLLVRRSR